MSIKNINKINQTRVLWLTNFPLLEDHKGHAASWITSLASLIKNDVALTIISWKPSIKENITIQRDGITYVYLRAPRGSIDLLTGCQLKIKRLKSFLNEYVSNYDLIHIHGSENQYVAACAGFDIPKILSVQGIISECYKIIPETFSYRRFYWFLAGYYERKYCQKLKHFMCRTHWDTQWVKQLAPAAHIHNIWEVIRPDFFSVTDNFTANTNLLYVGGMQSIKGFRELLIAFNIVKVQHSSIKLIILGSKPANLNKVKRFLKRDRLTNISLEDLDFRGMQDVPGMIKAYKESFCLVHPSYIDNSPNSVCEAQIAGLPVIASNVGGVSSLIEDGVTGLLTSLEPEQIAKQIITLLVNQDLQQMLSSNGRRIARERHSSNRIKQNVLNAYHSTYGKNTYEIVHKSTTSLI
ncbi:glycosyltransferase family 4 protein [Spirosoma fluminis]